MRVDTGLLFIACFILGYFFHLCASPWLAGLGPWRGLAGAGLGAVIGFLLTMLGLWWDLRRIDEQA